MANQQTAYKSKILLVTKATFFDIDKLGATTILGKLLADKHNTTVDIYFDFQVPRAELSRVVAPRSINFIESLEANYFTISIERGNARVKEVKWEEKEDKIRLLVFTEKGEIEGNKYMVDPGSPHYDLAYSIGIKSEQDLLAQLGEFSGIWSAAETINIDIRGENTKFAQTNYVYADAKSYAEAVLELAEETDLDIPNPEATELLACLYWKTNSLRNRHTSTSSFSSVDKLLKKGASLPKAVDKIYASVSLLEIKARQEMLASLVVDSDKIAFSKVNPETAKQLVKRSTANPNKNPLFVMQDIAASFVLVPIAADKTLVLVSSLDEKINARKLFGQYSYVGDRLQAEMSFDLNLEEAEAKIRSILEQKVFNRQEKPTESPKEDNSGKKQENLTSATVEGKVQKEQTKTKQPPAEAEQPHEAQALPDLQPVMEVKETPVEPPTQPTNVDPLAPATEVITPKPTSESQPSSNGNGFGSFGSIGGFGGGAGFGGNGKDPLPAA